MAQPFRIGVMQLTMEPLEEMLESARAMDRGRHGHDLARRGVSVVAQARDGGSLLDRRLGADRDARPSGSRSAGGSSRRSRATRSRSRWMRGSSQEAAGPGRFLLGLRHVEDLPEQRRASNGEARSGRCETPSRSCAACSAARRSTYEGETWSADVPGAAGRGGDAALGRAPSTSPATAPKMQALAGEIADGCLTPSITTPAFVRYTRENVGRPDIDIGCTIVASIDESDRERRPRRRPGDRRHVPREQGAEHPGVGRHAARSRGPRRRTRSDRSPRRWSRAAGSPPRRR